MNKLQGFYELKYLGIPSIPWKTFSGNETLDPNMLWTIRVAVEFGEDISLPRAVGVTAEEAQRKGQQYLKEYGENGIVIYYPYFIALKSGNIEIKEKQVIIEAVKGDLWNLTEKGCRDITIIHDIKTSETKIFGNPDFLKEHELKELQRYVARVRVKYKDYIFDKSSIMLEWSYAINTDVNKRPIGERYLVFYELRRLGTHRYYLPSGRTCWSVDGDGQGDG